MFFLAVVMRLNLGEFNLVTKGKYRIFLIDQSFCLISQYPTFTSNGLHQ